MCQGVKELKFEFYHSNETSTKVKNDWRCTSLFLYAFMSMTGTTLLFCSASSVRFPGH